MSALARNEIIQDARARSPEAIPILLAAWSSARLFGRATELGEEQYELLRRIGLTLIDHPPTAKDASLTPFDLILSDVMSADQGELEHLPALVISSASLVSAFDFVAATYAKRATDWAHLSYRPAGGVQATAAAEAPRPALFLDRDGTIIDLVPYITDPALVALKSGIVDLIRWARSAGYVTVCVTNQSGIGRQYYTWAEFDAVQAEMNRQLGSFGISLEASFAAGYHAESDIAEGHYGSGLRKPSPGMLVWASRLMNLDLANSIMIGDSDVDVGAGLRAGCRHVFQIGVDKTLAQILEELRRAHD